MSRGASAIEFNTKLVREWCVRNGVHSQALSYEMGYSRNFWAISFSRGKIGSGALVSFSKMSGIDMDALTNLELTDDEIRDIVKRGPLPTRNDWVTKTLVDKHREEQEEADSIRATAELILARQDEEKELFSRLLNFIGEAEVTLKIRDLVDLLKGEK